jgi:hypothetical protein
MIGMKYHWIIRERRKAKISIPLRMDRRLTRNPLKRSKYCLVPKRKRTQPAYTIGILRHGASKVTPWVPGAKERRRTNQEIFRGGKISASGPLLYWRPEKAAHRGK